MIGRFITLVAGIILFAAFCCASIPTALWLGSVGGAFARSNKLWVYCDFENTAPFSVYIWEPTRSDSDNDVRIFGIAGSILIDRTTGTATIGASNPVTPVDWSPDSLRAFALRCGCHDEVVTTEAASELFDAIENIRRDGQAAMHYTSEMVNYYDDRDVPSMKYWEAYGPGYRWTPVYWRMAILVVLWICCQIAAIYGIVRLIRCTKRNLSARSDARTPCSGS